MRTARFETFLCELLASSAHPAIKNLATFEEAGLTPELPRGVEVTFVTGARIVLQIVRTAADGGDQNATDLEGEPPAAVETPAFEVAEQVRTKDFETWLTALLINSQNPEIREVKSFTGRSHRYGIATTFHNGAKTFIYFPYTLRSGQQVGAHPVFEAKEAV